MDFDDGAILEMVIWRSNLPAETRKLMTRPPS